MPTYVYQCPGCDWSEDVFHEMTAVVAIVCNDCLVPLVRRPQPMSVNFIGEGFYSGGKS
jgi:predicted nucleic acid-binding Zn ribbon protein